MLKCHLGLGPWTATRFKKNAAYHQRDHIFNKIVLWHFLHSDDYDKILKSHGNVKTMIFKFKFQNSKGLQERKKCVERNTVIADKVLFARHSGCVILVSLKHCTVVTGNENNDSREWNSK